jgi:type IV secretory pathway VirB10-like protein
VKKLVAEKIPDLNEPTESTVSYEEPVGITKPNVSMTKSPTPKGTFYNKNVALMGLFGILLAFGLVIVITMSFGSKKPGSSQITASQDNQQNSGNQVQDLTPAELGKIPSSYGETTIGDKTYTNQPGPLDQGGQQSSSLSNKNGKKNNYNDSYSVPVPPPVQPIQVGQETATNNGPNSGQQELIAARKSQIRFGSENMPTAVNNQKKAEDVVMGDLNKLASQFLNQNGNPQLQVTQTQQGNDQNLQDEKRNFNSQNGSKPFYASSLLTPPLSPYEVKAGSIIPVVLITGLNSDLPGNVIAQVRENVYDTVSGKYLLIPQGTKVIGVYDSKVAYAQRRALVNWNRLIFPNGNSLDLQTLAGVDQSGYTGLKDKVNNHTGRLITGVLLTSILGAAVEMSQGTTSNSVNPTYEQLAAQGVAQNLSNVGQQITEKNLNVQPTLEIRPGFLFNLFVDKDFILQPYK